MNPDPSFEEVVSAFAKVTVAMSHSSKPFDPQEFLIHHGVEINKNSSQPQRLTDTLWDMLLKCPVNVDIFATDSFDSIFSKAFGCRQDWIKNWMSIAKDALDLKHFLDFKEFYLESSAEELLTNNFDLDIAHVPTAAVQNFESVEALIFDIFMKGGKTFVDAYSGMTLAAPGVQFKFRANQESVSFRRIPGLDQWGAAKFNGQWVDMSDFDKLYQLDGNLSHIGLENVKFILKEFFVPNGYGVFEQPDKSYKLCLDITPGMSDLDHLKCLLLTSYTQNGKTEQMVALCWILFFCHGYGSYLLCRSDSQEYHVLKQAVDDFNKKLTLWASSSNELRGNINLFHIEPLPLSHCSKSQLTKRPFSEELTCVVRFRLLQASNVGQAIQEIEFMNHNMNDFGYVDAHQRRHKFAVIIDEAQNIHQTFNEKLRVEKIIRELMKTVSICIEVSATQEAAFVMKSLETVQMLFIPVKPDYYGYSNNLPESRRIHISTVEEYFEFPTTSDDSVQDMMDYGAMGLVRKIMEEPCDHPRHWLSVVGSTSNSNLIDMGTNILRQLNANHYDQPVIVVLAIAATSTIESGGSMILFNRTAGENLSLKHIENADGEFFIAPRDVDMLPQRKRHSFLSTKNGFNVEHNGKKLTKISKRCSEDTVKLLVEGYTLDVTDVVKLSLPRVGGHYRLRTQLSLVEVLMRDMDFPNYTVITIGNRLIREGITPKTKNHTLALEKMFCFYPQRGFGKRTIVALTQTMGRLCGTRKDGLRPSLYIRADCRESFCEVIAYNDWAMRAVNQHQASLTIEQIMTRHGANNHAHHPIINGVHSYVLWPSLPQREGLADGIMAMRQWFSDRYQGQNTASSNFNFDDMKTLIRMLHFLADESIVSDQMDEWYYGRRFQNEESKKMRQIMNKLFTDLSCAWVWVDLSEEDGDSSFPIGVRKFKQTVISQSIAIRLNAVGCENNGIRNGLVLCTCSSICRDLLSDDDDCPFTYCAECRLYCHNKCQPCMQIHGRGHRRFCGRCRSIENPHSYSSSAFLSDISSDNESIDDKLFGHGNHYNHAARKRHREREDDDSHA